MFSSFTDPFFNDPFFSTSSPLLLTPYPRLMSNTGSQGGNTSTALTGSNSNNNNSMSLQNSNMQNPNHQWLNWNHLFEDPLQLGLNDKGDSYELMTRKPTGLRKKDVHLEIHDNVLTISGEREKHRKNRANNEERSEWVSFSRSLVLPNDVDPSKITAKYDDNQELHVELPKKPGSGRRSIEIQGSAGMDQKDQQRTDKTSESGNLGTKQQTESDRMQVDKEQGQGSSGASMRKTSEPRSQTQRVPISK